VPGSDDGPHRSTRRTSTVVALAGVALVLFSIAGSVRGATPAPSPLGGGPCAGSVVGTSYGGSIVIDGGPLASSTRAGASIDYSFSVAETVVDRTTGAVVSSACVVENGTAVSNASGAFGFQADPPGGHCPTLGAGGNCTEYSGPYGPVTVRPALGPPAGYTVEVAGSGLSFRIEYVALLASVSLSPSAAVRTTSVGAPLSFEASAEDGLGNASPVDVRWNWSLTGPGWSFVGPTDGATATVRASAGAMDGSLAANASATLGGTPWAISSPVVGLSAVATTISSLTVSEPVADAGVPVVLTVAGTGAAGFNYSASVAPGDGLRAVAARCGSNPSGGGSVQIECRANVTYPAPTNATPSARLTNGYSDDAGAFPSLAVVPVPDLSLTAGDAVGYAGGPIPFRLAATPGTGARPFAEACLASGAGPVSCTGSPGPNWTFSAVYSTPGNYTARAWALDADRTNESASAPMRLVARPTLAPLVEQGNATVGGSIELASWLSGGALPGTVWWNSSALAGPVATEPLGSDGPLAITFAPAVSGAIRFTVTVEDALGTVVSAAATVSIAPAPTGALRATGDPLAASALVGHPIPLSWQAFGPDGAPNLGFASAAELLVENAGTGAAVPAWANGSADRPLAPLGDAAFAVPVTAWAGGALNLTVTAASSGPVEVSLVGTGLSEANPPARVLVLPDPDHLRLSAPDVRVAGTRTNATLWRVSDPFGDPVPGSYLTIQTLVGGGAIDDLVPVVALGPGASGAWVNFSLPAIGGTVRVLDPAGAVLLGPLVVPPLVAPAARDPSLLTLGAAVPIGAAVAGASIALRRREAPGEDRAHAPPTVGEPELERFAFGRAEVVALVRRAGAIDLSTLESAWTPPPAPPDLADWIASLVADGTLGAEIGPDGAARFAIAAPVAGPPRVTIDVDAYDRALARRSEELDANDPPSGPD